MEKKNFVILLISIVIAVFLGSFTASLFIFGSDRPMTSYPHPFFFEKQEPPSMPKDFDSVNEHNQKIMEQQAELFNKMDDDFEDVMENAPKHASFGYMSNAGLKTQETKDMYKIIVDLKPFNNDSKNVDVKVKRNTVTISAKYKSKNKDEFSSSEVYQSLMLPSEIDASAVTTQKEGDSLVIVIPKINK